MKLKAVFPPKMKVQTLTVWFFCPQLPMFSTSQRIGFTNAEVESFWLPQLWLDLMEQPQRFGEINLGWPLV